MDPKQACLFSNGVKRRWRGERSGGHPGTPSADWFLPDIVHRSSAIALFCERRRRPLDQKADRFAGHRHAGEMSNRSCHAAILSPESPGVVFFHAFTNSVNKENLLDTMPRSGVECAPY